MSSTTVNLDAMIYRADFASNDQKPAQSSERFEKIGLKDLVGDGAWAPKLLRKPDFQRETTQWKPSQVAMLIESFLDGELIPAVILWQSATSIFVIDGGHRLSALIAWALDDYGDGVRSGGFFKNEISQETKRLANRTRNEVEKRVGSYKRLQQLISASDENSVPDARMVTFATRGLQVQWIIGDADKAESSFFKINTQGSALDPIEEKILRNRSKPSAIAARSIARAATGHKYWSKFTPEIQEKISEKSASIHKSLFSPEVQSPVKTIDLPLGGTASITQTLDLLINLTEIVDPTYKDLLKIPDDKNGENTLDLLESLDRVVTRLVGNKSKSLGLHPFVYFYTSRGRHYPPLMLAIFAIVANQLKNNNKQWFKDFTFSRKLFEEILLENKGIITLLISALGSKSRVDGAIKVLELILIRAKSGNTSISPNDFAEVTGLQSRLYTIQSKPGAHFDDDAKSSAFLKQAFAQALKCPICGGFLDPSKSISYDHILKREHGGLGSAENCQVTHPYCNSSIKG
tara:strand:+ start:209 stop:1765 length:1557 start_codon:yes stop_codon:yes gene_type:complete